MTRLAIVVSHPIQHFTPFYRAIAADPEVELKVFFCSRIGLESYFDKDMNTEIAWAMDLLGGYEHEFLPGAESIRTTRFSDVNNPGVGAALDRFEPEVLLLHGYAQLTLLRALAWRWRRGSPLLMFGESHLQMSRSWLRRVTKELPLRALVMQCCAFLTISDRSEAYWRRYGARPEQLFRAPSTIDEALYRRARGERSALRSKVRRDLGLGGDDVVALTVGKLSERKRPFDVVDAAARLRKEGRPIHLVFAGDGVLMQALKARAAALNVPTSLLGFVNVDRLPEIYACADVLVHASGFEAFGYVANEAACIGLPLVVSDAMGAVGPTSIARHGVNAAVFRCGDVAALADALGMVAFDRETRARMGTASMAVFDELDMRKSLAGLKAALGYCQSAPRGEG